MTPLSPSAQAWLDFTTALGEVGVAVHQQAAVDRSPEQLREVNRALMVVLSSSTLFQLALDPDQPDWLPRLNSTFNICAASPDNTYSTTQVDGRGTYLVTGQRGTCSRVHLSVDGGMMGYTPATEDGHAFSTYGAYDLDDFEIAEDGSFEILVCAERPAGHTGNWVALEPTAERCFLLVRQVAYDLSGERDGWLTIRRLDHASPPRHRSADVDERLAGLAEVVGRTANTILRTLSTQDFHGGELNTVVDYTERFGGVTLIAGQSFFGGRFAAAADEAVVLEVRGLGDCAYWNVHLLDSFWNDLDFMFHQTSLNLSTAEVDPDGVMRLVISERDPEVANWLDKSDVPEVGLRLRAYQGPRPVATSRLVRLAELRDHLHPDTPVMGPQRRLALLGERTESLQRRRRW